MTGKPYKLLEGEIRPLATGRGGCYASDQITVEGHLVGYLYREPPDGPWDSGWRFFSGHESQDYVDDAGNIGIYDVNTIVNYDPAILSLLDCPIGSEFERDGATGRFVAVECPAIEDNSP